MPKFEKFCVTVNCAGLGKDGTCVLEGRKVTLDDAKARSGWLFDELGAGHDAEEAQDVLLAIAYGEMDHDTIWIHGNYTIDCRECCCPGASCVGCEDHWISCSDDCEAEADVDYRYSFENRTGIDFSWVIDGKAPKGADLSKLEDEIAAIEANIEYDGRGETFILGSQFLGCKKGDLLSHALRSAKHLLTYDNLKEYADVDPLSVWLSKCGKSPFGTS